MKKSLVAFLLVIALAMMHTTTFVEAAEGRSPSNENGACIKESVIKLKYDMQKHWIEHAWWTRSVIVSKLAELEDQNEVLARLLRNQEELGNLIKPYYGEEAGNKLTELLKEHIVIAGNIIDAAKKGDNANVEKLNEKWNKNADEIVAFLTSANPNWSKEKLTEMFYFHLKLTTDEVTHRLNKDWAEDIKTADLNETHLIAMGDMLTEGIVKQFPDKFK